MLVDVTFVGMVKVTIVQVVYVAAVTYRGTEWRAFACIVTGLHAVQFLGLLGLSGMKPSSKPIRIWAISPVQPV